LPTTIRHPQQLDGRSLNRATLARQLLLGREAWPALEVIDHLVGMQAQQPRDPYVGLWSRINDFEPSELERLITERRAVRSPLMRATIHLATAHDALALRPLLEPVFARTQRGAFGRQLAGADLEALTTAGRRFFADGARTLAEFRQTLGSECSGYSAAALGYSVSYRVPMVQVPPRGLWTTSGQARWTTTEAWLGRPLEPGYALDRLVLRYLAAFGPATVMDMQAWCGLTKLREIVDRLRPRLLTFRDEKGRELFDLPEAPRPDAETPAPSRFLPEYDNVLLGHEDRSRFHADADRRWMLDATEVGFGRILHPGRLGGRWKITDQAGDRTITIMPLSEWSSAAATEVYEEGRRLARMLLPEVPAAVSVSLSSRLD
jgi:hypothetical protein